MKKINKKYLILIAILLIGLFYFLFSKPKGSNQELVLEGAQESEKIENISYSRINFFLDKENKASINIPGYWEGNYRLKENNDRVDFIFLKDGIEKNIIFSIEMKRKNDDKRGDDDSVILENENYYYMFLKSKDDNDDIFYKKMKGDINNLLKSFKIS